MKRGSISFNWIVAVFLFVIAMIIPFVLKEDPYYVHIFILIFLFGYLATAWGLVGQSGQLSFGHAVFVGLGGYTSTILFMDYGVTPWIGMFAGVIIVTLFGLIIGYPTLRLRGPYFALATLAFALILQTYVVNTQKIGPIKLRGAMGLLLPLQNGGDAPAVFQFATKTPYYFIALAFMVSAVLLSYTLNRRRIGFYWTAIRSDQDAAESLGINASRYRLLAFIISCALTSLGGTLWAQYFHYINPERGMALSLSIEIVLVGVVGGWQTVAGPMVGALAVIPISELLRAQLGGGLAGLHTFIYGLILMGVILWLPKGLNPFVMRGLKWLGDRLWSPSPAVRIPEEGKRLGVRRSKVAKTPILEVKNLTKSFGGLTAVNDLSFNLNESEIIGLIGPNGAGKTTVFNMLAGYYKPDGGGIVFQNQDITGLKPHEICRRGIARTFQVTKPFLDSTVLENVMVGGFLQASSTGEAWDNAWKALETLDFAHRAESMGHELNVPDRKRLEIARALATGAKVLLLDEPMAGLTPWEKTHIIELLRKINEEGSTLVVVEHDMKVVMSLCPHIVLMDRAMKLVEGTPEEVCGNPKAIAAYLGEEYAVRDWKARR